MVRLAWLLSGNRQVAEDVVHDAFLGLEPRWQDVRDPVPYLRRSVVNGVKAHHRRREVEQRYRPAPPEPALNPEMEEAWALVSQLPARQRHALVLRFYLDLTVEQVAEQLGCPLGTAKSLIHRGIHHVRERIEQ
jgi:RNA polymerase sigma factor (sigma-70 family)